ncbi:MAG: hypothetical protein AABX51_04110 [Nanoarchaeota archaeon]
MGEYPFPVLEHRINDTLVQVIGEFHGSKFWEENKDFLTDRIEESDAVIYEGFRPQSNNTSQCVSYSFSAGKPLYVVDLNSSSYYFPDILLASVSPAVGLTTMLVSAGINQVSADDIAIIAASGFCWNFSFQAYTIRRQIHMKTGQRSVSSIIDLVEKWTPNFGDFRDVRIADGIIKIVNAHPEYEIITALHGEGHSDGINRYLEHPIQRQIKKILYTPFNSMYHKNPLFFPPELWHKEGVLFGQNRSANLPEPSQI